MPEPRRAGSKDPGLYPNGKAPEGSSALHSGGPLWLLCDEQTTGDEEKAPGDQLEPCSRTRAAETE